MKWCKSLKYVERCKECDYPYFTMENKFKHHHTFIHRIVEAWNNVK